MLDRLAATIDELRPERRVLVAIDGADAAGKSTLARAVAGTVTRPAVCASIDTWHRPRFVRHQQGGDSAAGYYEDSFDYAALVGELIEPFRSGASSVTTTWFDHLADQPRRSDVSDVPPTAALLMEGVFLQRPELRGLWDLRVYLQVPESVTLSRALERDAADLGGPDAVRQRYQRRYLPGQRLYRDAAAPVESADIVVDNTDPLHPVVVRWSA